MRKRINTKVIALRLPQDEAERIKEAADAAEMSVSMWLRQAAAEQRLRHDMLSQMAGEKDND